MKLTVVLANTWRTQLAVIHEGEHLPYSRRTVQIELTTEQEALLRPIRLGSNCGKDVFEEYAGCWLETCPPNGGEQ